MRVQDQSDGTTNDFPALPLLAVLLSDDQPLPAPPVRVPQPPAKLPRVVRASTQETLLKQVAPSLLKRVAFLLYFSCKAAVEKYPRFGVVCAAGGRVNSFRPFCLPSVDPLKLRLAFCRGIRCGLWFAWFT